MPTHQNTGATEVSKSRQPLRKFEDLLQEVADLTGLSFAQLKDQLQTLDFPTYEFQGMVLVSPHVTDPLIDHWSEQIKAKLRSSESTDSEPAPTTKTRAKSQPKQSVVLEPTAIKTTALEATNGAVPSQEEEEDMDETEMKLPRGFSQLVSNRYGPTLEKLLPESAEERQGYLQEIVAETENGRDYLMRLATAIQRKYKGRTGRGTAYKKLLAKAKEMWESMLAAGEVMKQLEG